MNRTNQAYRHSIIFTILSQKPGSEGAGAEAQLWDDFLHGKGGRFSGFGLGLCVDFRQGKAGTSSLLGAGLCADFLHGRIVLGPSWFGEKKDARRGLKSASCWLRAFSLAVGFFLVSPSSARASASPILSSSTLLGPEWLGCCIWW